MSTNGNLQVCQSRWRATPGFATVAFADIEFPVSALTDMTEIHWVSEKHLKRYVAEMTYRFNARELTVTDRMNGLFTRVEGPIPYKVQIRG